MRMSRLFPRNSFKELSSDILHRRCKAQFAGTFTSMCGFQSGGGRAPLALRQDVRLDRTKETGIHVSAC